MHRLRSSHPSPGTIIALILTVAVLLCYAPILHAPFVFDDHVLFGQDKVFAATRTLAHVWTFMPFRFLPNATLWVTYLVDGNYPILYHLGNIFLHLITGAAVYAFSKKIATIANQHHPRPWIFPALVTTLFLLHPVQTESVTYVFQRSTVMVALFVILFFITTLRWLTTPKPSAAIYVGSLTSVVCACLSKENAFMVPLLLAWTLYCWFPAPHYRGKKVSILLGVSMLVTILFFLLSFSTQTGKPLHSPNEVVFHQTQITHPPGYQWHYALTQINVTAMYLRLIAYPIHQTLDYDYPLVQNLSDIQPFALLTHLILISTALCLYKKNRILSYGIGWYYCTLLVESSIIPLDDVVFEHRLYLPSIGIFLAGSSYLNSWIQSPFPTWRRASIRAATSAVLLAFAIATFQRNQVWSTPQSLYQDAVNNAPNKVRPNLSLAIAYQEEADLASAITQYRRVLQLDPNSLDALTNLGRMLWDQGDQQEAMTLFSQAYTVIHTQPSKTNAGALMNIAVAFYRTGDRAKTEELLLQATNAAPRHQTKPFRKLAEFYTQQQQSERAIPLLQEVIRRDPGQIQAYTLLATAYDQNGHHAEAAAARQTARSISLQTGAPFPEEEE